MLILALYPNLLNVSLNEKTDDILKIDFSKGIRYGGE